MSEAGPISARGKCRDCALSRMFAVLDALDAHDGAAFQSWRRSVAASVGAVLLDDLTSSPENGRRDA